MILNDDHGYDHSTVTNEHIELDDSRIARIERIRFLKEGFRLELSYCIAVLKDGTKAYVHIDSYLTTVRTVKGDLIAEARNKKVYAKGLGLLDNISIY